MKEHFKFKLLGFNPDRFAAMLLVSILALLGGTAATYQITNVRTVNTIAELVSTQNPLGVYRTFQVLGYYSPGDGGGGLFVVTNTATSTNIGTRIYSGTASRSYERVRIPGALNLSWFGAKKDGTLTDAALVSAVGAASAHEYIEITGPGAFDFNGTNITKDVSMIGVNRPTLRRHAAGTTNIFNFTVPQTGLYKGLIVDGNKANVSTNTWTLLSSWYWNSDGATIEDVTFTNTMYRAILDYQSVGDTTMRSVKAFNNYAVPTNFASHSFAFAFAPGQANQHVNLFVYDMYIENETWTNTVTQPAGLIVAASDSVNNSTISLYIHGYHGKNVGGDHVIGDAHYGGPFLDVYGPGIYRVHGDDLSVTGNKYIPFKLQNAKHLSLSKLYAETDSLAGLDICPGERAQTNAYQNHIVRDVTIIGDPSRTLGFAIRAGYSGGFTNVTIDHFKGESLLRIGQIEGIDDAGDVVHPGGPVLLNDIQAEGGTGIVFLGFDGDATISNSSIVTTNGGAIVATAGTNQNANIRIRNTRANSATGNTVAMFGVKSLESEGNILIAGAGKAVWLDDDAAGNKIQKLSWDRSTQIISGSVDITRTNIVSGYFNQDLTETYYPSGAQTVTSGQTNAYYKTFKLETETIALLTAFENLTGPLAVAFKALDGQLSVVVQDDRAWLKPESTLGGTDLGGTQSGQYSRIYGGASTEALRAVGTNTVANGAIAAHILGATNSIYLGSLAADPSSLTNGMIWYNSSLGKFRKREAGATSDLDTGGGGGTDDQTAAEVPSTPAGTLAADDVQEALNELDTEKSATGHAHAASDTTSGTFDAARIPSTQATDAEVTAAVAALSSVYQPLDSDLTSIAALTTTSFGRNLLALANAAAGQTAFGLVIGTDVQAQDSDLAAIAALTTTSFGRSVLEAANASALRTLAGLIIGTDVQAFDGDLSSIAALTTTSYGRGLLTLASATTLRADISVPIFDSVDPGASNLYPKWDDSDNEVDWIAPETYFNLLGAGGIQKSGTNVTVTGNISAYGMSVEQMSMNTLIVSNLTTDAILKVNSSGVVTNALQGTDYLTGNSTNTLTNKGYDAGDTGNTLKFLEYRDFVFPTAVDGAGTTMTTNNYASFLSGKATSAGSGSTNANYALFDLGTVPRDIDTATELVLKDLAIRVSGTDTDSATFTIGLWSPASSGAASPTDYTSLSTFISIASGTLTSPAAGDIFYINDVTLTGWAAAVTGGRPFVIGIARLDSSNDDSITIMGGSITYKRTK